MHDFDNRRKAGVAAENWVRLGSHYILCCRFLPLKARGTYRFELKDAALVMRAWLVLWGLVIAGTCASRTAAQLQKDGIEKALCPTL